MLEDEDFAPSSDCRISRTSSRRIKVKTTGVAVGLHWPYKDLLLAGILRRLELSFNCITYPAARKRAFTVLSIAL